MEENQNWVGYFLAKIQEYPDWSYVAIALFLMLGIFLFPLPDELTMVMLGYWTSIGQLSFWPTLLSATLGSMGGVTISYSLGRALGYPLLHRYGPRFFLTHERLEAAQVRFLNSGYLLLFFGYFILGVRHLVAYFSGIARHPYPRFAAAAYTGAMLWCGVFVGAGNLLGPYYTIVLEFIRPVGGGLLGLLILAWFGRFFYRRHRRSLLLLPRTAIEVAQEHPPPAEKTGESGLPSKSKPKPTKD